MRITRVKMLLWIRLLMMITISISTLGITGCAGPTNSAYREFTLRMGSTHFSFEYPASYQKPHVDWTALPQLTSVTILHVIGNGGESSIDSHIGIYLMYSKYYSTDAKALLESDLAEYENGSYVSDFKLLDRSQISVSGIQGEQFSYSHTWYPDALSPKSSGNPYPMLGRIIYFYSDGVIWELSVDSPLSTAEQAKIDFDHILQTFKILD